MSTEIRSLTVFHIRIKKQKINKSSNGRIGQHQGLNDKLNGIRKQDKQEKGKAIKDSTQKDPKECI